MAEANVSLAKRRIRGDVHFRRHLAGGARNNVANSHAGSEVEIGGNDVRRELIADQSNAIGFRTRLQRRSIEQAQRRVNTCAWRRPAQLHIEAEFLVLPPEPAAL